MSVIAARPALGKALALDTPLPTPAGWTTMGEVRVGDELIGADGRPVNVVAATQVMHDRPCYEVEFSTGEIIVADGQHQWITWDHRTRKTYDRQTPQGSPAYPGDWPTWDSARPSRRRRGTDGPEVTRDLHGAGLASARAASIVGRTAVAVRRQRTGPDGAAGNAVRVTPRTTAEIAATLRARGQSNHAVPATRPLVLPAADLPVEPYILGYLLGAGETGRGGRVACDPRDRIWLTEEFRFAGYQVSDDADPGHFGARRIGAEWCSAGLAAGKHIP